MKYKVIVFDFDGTFADSFPFFVTGFNRAAAKYSFQSLSKENTDQLRNLGARELIRRLNIPFWKVPLVGYLVKKQLTSSASEIKLFPGVSDLILGLREKGVRVAILTSNIEENVRTILGEDLSSRIDCYQCNVGVFSKKKALSKMLRRNGWLKTDVLMVGDEVRDAEAARECGVDFCAVSWGYNSAPTLEPLSVWKPLQSFEQLLLQNAAS